MNQYLKMLLFLCTILNAPWQLYARSTGKVWQRYHSFTIDYLATIGTCHILKNLSVGKDTYIGGDLYVSGQIHGIIGNSLSVATLQVTTETTATTTGDVTFIAPDDRVFPSITIGNTTTTIIFQNLIQLEGGRDTNATITTLYFPTPTIHGQRLSIYFDFTDDSNEVWTIGAINTGTATLVGSPPVITDNGGTTAMRVGPNAYFVFVYSKLTNTWYRA